jgi:hypothetical protein
VKHRSKSGLVPRKKPLSQVIFPNCKSFRKQGMDYELDVAEDMLEGRLEKEVNPMSAIG